MPKQCYPAQYGHISHVYNTALMTVSQTF